MKYKVGDKVIIKKDPSYHPVVQVALEKHNWILTIVSIESSPLGAAFPYYIMKEISWHWNDGHIQKRCTKTKERCGLKPPEPIENRFEILDL